MERWGEAKTFLLRSLFMEMSIVRRETRIGRRRHPTKASGKASSASFTPTIAAESRGLERAGAETMLPQT